MRRTVDLRTELEMFLNEKNHRLAARFQDKSWMLQVCYLNDVFSAVNELNTSMQGRDRNIIALSEKLSAFKEKLRLWKGKLDHGRTASFPSLSEYLERFEEFDFNTIKSILVEHLQSLI